MDNRVSEFDAEVFEGRVEEQTPMSIKLNKKSLSCFPEADGQGYTPEEVYVVLMLMIQVNQMDEINVDMTMFTSRITGRRYNDQLPPIVKEYIKVVESALSKNQRYNDGVKLHCQVERKSVSKTWVTGSFEYTQLPDGDHYVSISMDELIKLVKNFSCTRGTLMRVIWLYLYLKGVLGKVEDESGVVGYGYPVGAKHLARVAGISERTCQDYVNMLCKLGLITVVPGNAELKTLYILGNDPDAVLVVKRHYGRVSPDE